MQNWMTLTVKLENWMILFSRKPNHLNHRIHHLQENQRDLQKNQHNTQEKDINKKIFHKELLKML